MLNKIKGLFIEEKGQGMTEYGLILGLIAVAIIGVLGFLGGDLKGLFENLRKELPGANTTEPTV
ncbi:Flp family type IVb pilin [Oceanobacillus damuensis]|uniref:Flp family type IVb pilin n=1 Tax=Oceanobacillus damuensis TaxID=937928 RepID=UPI000831A265|nr:Flp family type IVb pilin [Oceanobacillus damuensis]